MAMKMGLTPKQRRAHEKYSLYEKAWERMNRIVTCIGSHHGKTPLQSTSTSQMAVLNSNQRHSLVDKQRHYISPREDCLSDFYQSA